MRVDGGGVLMDTVPKDPGRLAKSKKKFKMRPPRGAIKNGANEIVTGVFFGREVHL